MQGHNRLYSVRALRYAVAASFIVAALAAATSIHLTHRQAKGNLVLIEIGSATSDVISLYADGLQMGQATRNILLDPTNKAAYVNHDSAVKEFSGTLQSLKQHAQALFHDEAELRQLDGIERDFRSHVTVQRKIHDLARQGDFEQSKVFLNSEDTPLWRKYKQKILDFRKWLDNQSSQVSAGIQRDSRLAETASWMSGLILLLANLLAFTTAGRVGKLLRHVAQDLLDGAEQIARAAGQVSSSSQSLAQGASEQAASLEETSASTEEINSMARRNSEHSQAATELVTQSEAKVNETSRALEQTVAAITDINISSDKISKIIEVIDEIAFQTNILALNAAVEAARAGAAGMGFGVVADEVRNLARRCAEAAKDTASLIENSVNKSRDGKAKVDQVAVAIRCITEDSQRIKALVGEVSTGSLEQARGIAQIAEAIAQMGQVTQNTAATAEESAAATTEMDAQARGLREIAEQLMVVVGG